MKILYFDAFSGLSGDMILGSLIGLGVDFDWLKAELKKLPLDGYNVNIEQKSISGIAATKFNVDYEPEQKHRHLSHIVEIINNSTLSDAVKKASIEIFDVIAVAEAKIHGTTKEKVHFHEVGAIDSIIDIVGSCIALDSLCLDKVMSSPLPLGRGFVDCDHGRMPLPAPATLEILKNFPTYGVPQEGEFVTPTGAAIIKTWATEVGDFPDMKPSQIGFGAGSAKREIPNLLRTIMGESISVYDQHSTIVKDLLILECNLDDMNPEFVPYLSEKFLSMGALDFYTNPITMKKGRNGIKLSVLIEPMHEKDVLNVLYKETTTLGVRKFKIKREELKRKSVVFESSFGAVRVKESYYGDQKVNAKPEYEEMKTIAQEKNIALKQVYQKVMLEYHEKQKLF